MFCGFRYDIEAVLHPVIVFLSCDILPLSDPYMLQQTCLSKLLQRLSDFGFPVRVGQRLFSSFQFPIEKISGKNPFRLHTLEISQKYSIWMKALSGVKSVKRSNLFRQKLILKMVSTESMNPWKCFRTTPVTVF